MNKLETEVKNNIIKFINQLNRDKMETIKQGKNSVLNFNTDGFGKNVNVGFSMQVNEGCLWMSISDDLHDYSVGCMVEIGTIDEIVKYLTEYLSEDTSAYRNLFILISSLRDLYERYIDNYMY